MYTISSAPSPKIEKSESSARTSAKKSEIKEDPTKTLTTYLETIHHCYKILPDIYGLWAQKDDLLATQDKHKSSLDKNIENHSKKLDSITKLPFSKMGNNEVPHDAPSTSPSAKTKKPLPLDFSLGPSIFTGSFQSLTSSVWPKYLSRGSPFVSPSTKKNILSSTDPLPAPNMIPKAYSAYFITGHQNSIPTSTLRRDTLIYPLLNIIWHPVLFHH